jgi:DNA polymerase III subunit delta
MKITYSQLFLNLKQNLAPIYVISGDEPVLVETAREAICQQAAIAGFNHRDSMQLDSEFSWEDFISCAYNLSLFATKQIIELRLPQGKPGGDSGSKILVEYAQKTPRDKILVIIAPKIDSATQKSKWFKALEQCGVVVQIWPLDPQQLRNWIANQAAKLGLNLSNNGVNIIAEYTAGNLLATQQELEKLHLLYNCSAATNTDPSTAVAAKANKSTIVNDEQIIAALSDNARFTIFDLVDALYLPHYKQALNILQHLETEEIEPILVLWALTRELRLLLSLKCNECDSAQFNQILNYNRGYKIKNENKPRIKKLLQKLTITKLERTLQHAALVDQMLKGSGKLAERNVWHELWQLVAQICNPRSC